ncbi:MAG TPA: hypothetical protein VJN89_02015 [Candidatus Acidoferrum sp.]|nr:hypothetical protein [Candidatus Acidoferrum sp.]
MQPPRAPIPDKVVAQLLYEADHTCCICRNKKFDVQIHHITGRMDSRPANLIIVCLNCHSEVERKGGLGRAYSPGELRRYKESALREIAMRRKRAKVIDQFLALFEVKRLTYKFQALDFRGKGEPRALELMRLVMQFGRDGGYEIKEDCVSFVYETSDWLRRGTGSPEFVSHQTTILMECAPIGAGGLVAPSSRPLGKRDLDLLKHIVNVSGDIAYAVCKYIRNKEAAEHAILMLHDLLRFAILNNLTEFEKDALHEFEECERICRHPLNYGVRFEAGLKLLESWKKEALTYWKKKALTYRRKKRISRKAIE